MDFHKLIKKFSILNNSNENRQHLSKLVSDFKQNLTKESNHPFKIIDIKEKGFIIKMYGLYGFISFNHMAWFYKSLDVWQYVFPYLKAKFFFGKIHLFDEDKLSLIVDAKVPQFKKLELIEDEFYEGVVIHKSKYGVFLDIGLHFNWKAGSLVGLVHKNSFEFAEEINSIELGSKVNAIYWGTNENDEIILSLNTQTKEWLIGGVNDLLGTNLPVKIVKTKNDHNIYIIKDKYIANLSANKLLYGDNTITIKQAIKNLNHNDVIHCTVTKINQSKKIIHLMWDSEQEVNHYSSIQQSSSTQEEGNINADTLEKLELINTIVKVKVSFKTGQENYYLVQNKYKAKLKIKTKLFDIKKEEQKKIEEQLELGDTIECEVFNVTNDYLSVKWEIDYKQMFSLLYNN